MTAGTDILNFALSLAMIAAFVLGWFGARLVWTGRDRMRGGLMIGVAAVLIANVLIWVWPLASPPLQGGEARRHFSRMSR